MEQILIIEDDTGLNQGLCRALKSENRQVVSCLNLKTAREQLACGSVSLVLLDINLPDGSGLDFLQELKAAEPCADDQIMPGLQPLGRKSLTDRDGERVHRQTDAQQQDFQNTHILHSLYRGVLLISHRFRRKSRKKRDSRAFF